MNLTQSAHVRSVLSCPRTSMRYAAPIANLYGHLYIMHVDYMVVVILATSPDRELFFGMHAVAITHARYSNYHSEV